VAASGGGAYTRERALPQRRKKLWAVRPPKEKNRLVGWRAFSGYQRVEAVV
jgi:hypothetical protein